MRWFKHSTSTHNDEKIRELIHEYGLQGYGLYNLLLELISEKIDETLIPEIRISDRVLREKCRLSHKNLGKICSFFTQNSLIFSNFGSGFWNFKCPNLLKRLDNWTKRSVVKHEQTTFIDKEQEEEQEEEVEQEDRVKQPQTSKEPRKADKPNTLEEAKQYFRSLGFPDEAERWFDHFASNGWKVSGKSIMRDWQASARNWVRNSRERRFDRGRTSYQSSQSNAPILPSDR